MRLGDLTEIRTGFTARSSVEIDLTATDRAMHAGDMRQDGEILATDLIRANLSSAADRYRLADGDVVFRGRGAIRSATYRGTPNLVVALSPLMILRIRAEPLLPEYLAAFLRSRRVIAELESRMQGSSIRFVGKAEVEDLDIPVPPIEQQRRIIELDQLAQRERKLAAHLSDLRCKSLDAVFNHFRGAPTAPDADTSRETKHGHA